MPEARRDRRLLDAEHALDVTYARRLGVKTDELLISQPAHGEQALEIADTLKAWIEKGEFLLTEAVDRIPAY